MTKPMVAGDFSGLARNYTLYRPDYSSSIVNAILGLHQRPMAELEIADVGAGTGIWTHMLASRSPKRIIAVEPNDDMRGEGETFTRHTAVEWRKGSAEETTLENEQVDWLSMASSFHWANFETATAEFHRVLKPGGIFTAIWNPRLIETNPLLIEIEAHLDELKSGIKRVSSGRSGITETLTEQLEQSPYFEDVVYMEGRHVINMTQEPYLGAWRSVNDLQVQLGATKFAQFLAFIEEKLASVETIEATYLTRAWSARVSK